MSIISALPQIQTLPYGNTKIFSDDRSSLNCNSQFSVLHDYYKKELDKVLDAIDQGRFVDAVKLVETVRGKKNRVWTAGNGGSSAIAEHFAHNLAWDCTRDFPASSKISAICLSALGNEMTARANDASSDLTFATLLDDHAQKGDVFIGFSGSGESKNILYAINYAKKCGIKTIVIAKDNSSAVKMADVGIGIKSNDQQVIEDAAHIIMHQMVRALNVDIAGKPQEELCKPIAHKGRSDLLGKYVLLCMIA